MLIIDNFSGGVYHIAYGGSGGVAARRAVYPRLKAWADSYVAGFAAIIVSRLDWRVYSQYSIPKMYY